MMARQIHKLTALKVEKLKKTGLYADGGNLYLQITSSGVKSWLFRFMISGKPQAMGLGPNHTISLKEAREMALAQRKKLESGINPLSLKKEIIAAEARTNARKISFNACAEAYIDAHRASWNNKKQISQWSNTLKSYTGPIFGNLPVSDIDTDLIMKCLLPIWEEKHETASRLRGRIESVLSWATTAGYRTGDNPARWKGHLKNLLATIKKNDEEKHHPSLPWPQITNFYTELKKQSGNGARALEFLILTGCRSGNARFARWSEIDFENRIWALDWRVMKKRRPIDIPLSDASLNLLDSMPKSCEFIFPNTKGTPLSDATLGKVIDRMNSKEEIWIDPKENKQITPHGFRSTFKMWAAEFTNHPREVVEHALAHRIPDAVERAYQRGTQFPKRVALMADWAAYCCGK
jgi:hypothetical protein